MTDHRNQGQIPSDAQIEKPLVEQMDQLFDRAQQARPLLANATSEQKKQALHHMASVLLQEHIQRKILEANAKDLDQAKVKGATSAELDRLKLDTSRLQAMTKALKAIADSPDPVHQVLETWKNPANGLQFEKITTAIGVIAMVYEARPNVTTDAAALCIQSGNPVILRPGSSCYGSSAALLKVIEAGVTHAGLPAGTVGLVPSTDRAAVSILLGARGKIDLLIPRGGKSLTALVAREARVPTLMHLDGNCHTYVDAQVDIPKAIAVVMNAKLRRTGICGATESLIVHQSRTEDFLPQLVDLLLANGCELVGDARACERLPGKILPAKPEDFVTEFLAPKLSVAIVDSLDEAIHCINANSSGHTEAILSENVAAQQQFVREVDSAIVMINSSTQFADGGEFGFGAEIGIATGRLPPRGPVGARQLVTFKYVVRGEGHTRPGGEYDLTLNS